MKSLKNIGSIQEPLKIKREREKQLQRDIDFYEIRPKIRAVAFTKSFQLISKLIHQESILQKSSFYEEKSLVGLTPDFRTKQNTIELYSFYCLNIQSILYYLMPFLWRKWVNRGKEKKTKKWKQNVKKTKITKREKHLL